MIFIDNMHKQKIIGNIKNTFQTKILLSKKIQTNKQIKKKQHPVVTPVEM